VPDDAQLTRSVFRVPGMDCPTEEQLIRMALAGTDGVQSLDFDLADRQLEAIHVGSAESLLAALTPLRLGARLDSSTPLDPATAPPAHAGADQSAGAGPQRRALWWVLGINATMFIVELIAGLLAGSAGLVADSLDMLADATIYAVALLAGADLASQRRAARASGWLQLALAGLVLVEVIRRAGTGIEPTSSVMMLVGLLALVANLACVAILARHRSGGAHLRASWIFTTNDALANIGVIVAGVLVAVTGSAIPDLAIGAAIAALVASGAWRILRVD
jgi:Co/Zn/Cd efflux system component